MLKGILFDLGSTLWDDYPTTLFAWEFLAKRLTHYGFPTSIAQMEEDSYRIIASFSPSLNRAVVWQRTGRNTELSHTIMEELIEEEMLLFDDPAEFRRLNPLYPGVHEMLDILSRKYALAVVSQHFSEVEHWMTYHDIQGYFQHIAVSNTERIYKPDPRLFLKCCAAVEIDPREAMMVGDRIDNDIWPANRIGMTTVRVLARLYRDQQPRYPRDVPDYVIDNITNLLPVIEHVESTHSCI